MRNRNLHHLYYLYQSVRGPRLAVRSRGLTLIELLVAVAIVTIMIMVFGQILNSSQKAVSSSQTTMRTCAAGAAIEKVIRDDLRKVTRNGFLCITQSPLDGTPRLVAVTAGVTPSKTSSDIGNGGIVSLGLCANQAGGDPVLYHQAFVLAPGVTMSPNHDYLNYDLGAIVALPTAYVRNIYTTIISNNFAPGGGPFPSIRIPPNDLDQINALWQVLASQCHAISIQWTDGESVDGSGNLYWFGVEADDHGTPYDSTDDTYDANSKHSTMNQPSKEWQSVNFFTNPTAIEGNVGGGLYRAVWTKDDQSNWPKAIKISFTISDPALLDEGVASRDYEIICPVGQ